MRGFEKVSYIDNGIIPVRATKSSAGYDFATCEDFEVKPNETYVVKTGIKSYMMEDEVLKIYIRSSLGFKKSLMLANQTGIIDSDYYNNESNEGHIMIAIHNYGTETQSFKAGEKIAQGIFSKYLLSDTDNVNEVRGGGIGSTN